MLHHPHIITSHSECTMTKHIAPSNSQLDNQLCATPPQYLSTVVVSCLFSTLLHPGDVSVLVIVGALDTPCTNADIIGKVRHVRAIMINH
jgi:hypothetical protein